MFGATLQSDYNYWFPWKYSTAFRSISLIAVLTIDEKRNANDQRFWSRSSCSIPLTLSQEISLRWPQTSDEFCPKTLSLFLLMCLSQLLTSPEGRIKVYWPMLIYYYVLPHFFLFFFSWEKEQPAVFWKPWSSLMFKNKIVKKQMQISTLEPNEVVGAC